MQVNNQSMFANVGVKKPTYSDQKQEEMLFKNVDKFDTAAGGKKDGKVGLDDLKKIANDKNNNSEEAKMIRAMLKENEQMLVDTGIATRDKDGNLVNGKGADAKTLEKAMENKPKPDNKGTKGTNA